MCENLENLRAFHRGPNFVTPGKWSRNQCWHHELYSSIRSIQLVTKQGVISRFSGLSLEKWYLRCNPDKGKDLLKDS